MTNVLSSPLFLFCASYEHTMSTHTTMTMDQRVALCHKRRQEPLLNLKQLSQWLEDTHAVKISQSTISKTLFRSATILSSDHSNKKAKRQKPVKYPDMENDLMEWIEIYQSQIQLNGELIKSKGKVFLKALYGENADMEFSEGWLSSFKTRHGIKQYRTVGESGSVNLQTLEDRLPGLRAMLDRYALKDIYNMDETGLFYRMQVRLTALSRLSNGVKTFTTNVAMVLSHCISLTELWLQSNWKGENKTGSA